MDTVGSQRAALLDTGPQASAMALFFAARAERTTALILVDATARYLAADDYPIGLPPKAAEAIVARTEELWGTEAYTGIFASSRADDARPVGPTNVLILRSEAPGLPVSYGRKLWMSPWHESAAYLPP
jgi:hypothetical protein